MFTFPDFVRVRGGLWFVISSKKLERGPFGSHIKLIYLFLSTNSVE